MAVKFTVLSYSSYLIHILQIFFLATNSNHISYIFKPALFFLCFNTSVLSAFLNLIILRKCNAQQFPFLVVTRK